MMKIKSLNKILVNFVMNKNTFFLAIIAPVLGAVQLNFDFESVRKPISNGDLLAHYQYQDILWNGNVRSHYGFPIGQNIKIWPFLDTFQSLIVGIFHIIFPIITSVNLTILISFTINVLIIDKICRICNLSSIYRLILILSGISLPWWVGRVQHFDYYFIFMSLLPFIIYFNCLNNKIKFYEIIFLIAIGACSPYIFIFGEIVGIVLLLMSIKLIKNSSNSEKISLISIVIIPALSFIFNYVILCGFTLQTYPGMIRRPSETIHLAGYAFMPFLPSPNTAIPKFGRPFIPIEKIVGATEVTWTSNFGSLLLFLSFITIATFYIKNLQFDSGAIRNNLINIPNEIKMVFVILFTLFLFFIKGGFGALLGTLLPQIRSWNRLTPLIQLLALLLALYIFDNFIFHKKIKILVLVMIFLMVFSQFSTNMETRTLSTKNLQNENREISNFIQDYSKMIRVNCAILQLPVIEFPLAGDFYKMQDYDHFRISLIDRSHSFTYGLEKPNNLTKLIKKEIQNNNFCGFIVDSFGYSSSQKIYKLLKKEQDRVISRNKRYIFIKTNKKNELQLFKILTTN